MDIIAASIFALAGGIVAEKRRLPLIDVVLQPMTMFSAWQPPRAPRLEAMRHAPNGSLGRGWNRMLYSIIRHMLRRRYAAQIDEVRRVHGLAPSRGAPLIDRSHARVMTLCCYSPMLGPACPDAPSNTHVVGFPIFDSQSGSEEQLDDRLAAFLSEGEPPIVFSIGSVAWAAAGDFFDEAVLAARRLGRRAVLLTGMGETNHEGHCFRIAYAPHSKLFKRCVAIVHHGGIGSTGQALSAGRPQLVVPFYGDQYDNAARVENLKVGFTLAAARFTSDAAAAALGILLRDRAMAVRAASVARQVQPEDGAAEAARRIIAAHRNGEA